MDMSIEDKLSACREFRRRGNLFHREGQYRRGALQYRQVIKRYFVENYTIFHLHTQLRAHA